MLKFSQRKLHVFAGPGAGMVQTTPRDPNSTESLELNAEYPTCASQLLQSSFGSRAGSFAAFLCAGPAVGFTIMMLSVKVVKQTKPVEMTAGVLLISRLQAGTSPSLLRQ